MFGLSTVQCIFGGIPELSLYLGLYFPKMIRVRYCKVQCQTKNLPSDASPYTEFSEKRAFPKRQPRTAMYCTVPHEKKTPHMESQHQPENYSASNTLEACINNFKKMKPELVLSLLLLLFYPHSITQLH